MRVLVVAEWYPSPADPVHGIWAHRQALAARAAGADVSVLALRRPVPPIAVARRGPAAIGKWLLSFREALRPTELDGLRVRPVPFIAPPRPLSYASWGAWIAPALGRALASESFDLLHAHNVLPTGEALARLRGDLSPRLGGDLSPRLGASGSARWRPVKARFVVSTHGPDIIHVANSSPRAAVRTRQTLRAASVVIANSAWAGSRCEALAGTRLPLRVVHLGADLPASPPTRHSRPTLVTVAHLQARKRHAAVLRAIAAIPAQRRPDYVIVGDGEMRGDLQALTATLGLTASVRFLGQLDHHQALLEAWRGHVCVMPSVEEPFGVAYVEAMAGGLPAIGCSGQGGPEDIAAAGEGMVLVDPADDAGLAVAIERCLREHERLGARARETVQRSFTWDRCGAKTLEAYEAALG